MRAPYFTDYCTWFVYVRSGLGLVSRVSGRFPSARFATRFAFLPATIYDTVVVVVVLQPVLRITVQGSASYYNYIQRRVLKDL